MNLCLCAHYSLCMVLIKIKQYEFLFLVHICDSPLKPVLSHIWVFWDVYNFENCSPCWLVWCVCVAILSCYVFWQPFWENGPERFDILHIFHSIRGLESVKFPNVFMGINTTRVYVMLGFCRGTFYSAKCPVISHNVIVLYSRVGAFKPSL